MTSRGDPAHEGGLRAWRAGEPGVEDAFELEP